MVRDALRTLVSLSHAPSHGRSRAAMASAARVRHRSAAAREAAARASAEAIISLFVCEGTVMCALNSRTL